MYQKRLFKRLYFVPMISIVFLEERGGSYFYVGWLLNLFRCAYSDAAIHVFSHFLLVHLFPVLETMLFESLVC